MSFTIEQLKFAREIGATHINRHNDCYRKDFCAYFDGKWNAGWESADHMDASTNFSRIDFTPLEDYYADKAVDIAATGGEAELIASLDAMNAAYDAQRKPGDLDKLMEVAERFNEKGFHYAEKPDMVNHPPHYQTDGIECIDAIRASLGLEGFVAYCRGNAIKYSWRAGKKDETAQDLRKAAWYLNRAADELTKNNERSAGVNE